MEGRLFAAVSPLLRSSAALGLAPFYIPSLDRSEHCLNYSKALLFTMVTLFFVFNVVMLQEGFGIFSFWIIFKIFLFYLPIQAIRNHRLAIRIIEEINVIDLMLKSLQVTIPYLQNKLLVIGSFIPLCIYLTIFCVTIVSSFLQGDYIAMFAMLFIAVQNMLRSLVSLQFIASVMAAKQRRRLYNEALLHLANLRQSMDRDSVSEGDIDITWSARVISHRHLIRPASYQTVLLDKWQTLTKINKTLFDCVINISSYYSVTMFVAIISLIFSIMGHINKKKSHSTFNPLQLDTDALIGLLFILLSLLTCTAACTICVNEFEQTSVAAYKLSPNKDLVCIKKKLNVLLIGCIYRKPAFPCAGLFYIDYTLIPSLIGVMLTIIVQRQGHE